MPFSFCGAGEGGRTRRPAGTCRRTGIYHPADRRRKAGLDAPSRRVAADPGSGIAVDGVAARSYAPSRTTVGGVAGRKGREMTASEFAFLALGLVLGVATGSALVVVLRARPPAREIRVTVGHDAVPRRAATLSVRRVRRRPRPSRPGADRRIGGTSTGTSRRTTIPGCPAAAGLADAGDGSDGLRESNDRFLCRPGCRTRRHPDRPRARPVHRRAPRPGRPDRRPPRPGRHADGRRPAHFPAVDCRRRPGRQPAQRSDPAPAARPRRTPASERQAIGSRRRRAGSHPDPSRRPPRARRDGRDPRRVRRRRTTALACRAHGPRQGPRGPGAAGGLAGHPGREPVLGHLHDRPVPDDRRGARDGRLSLRRNRWLGAGPGPDVPGPDGRGRRRRPRAAPHPRVADPGRDRRPLPAGRPSRPTNTS